ncbi:MAG: uroporphyrinogen decarboxylase family protein [Candidatus Humimicrobiaceae bacterium]
MKEVEKFWQRKDVNMEDLINKVVEICNDKRYEKLQQGNKDIQILVVPNSDRAYLAPLFGINLIEYFKDPLKRLEFQLRTKIFHHEEVPEDDYIIPRGISSDYGMYLEANILGSPLIYDPLGDPWVSETEFLIDDKSKLDKINYPDFYKSGVMPDVHKMYNQYNEILGGRLPVDISAWYRGPWSVAQHIRGFGNLMLDLNDDPDFVHRLLRTIILSRMKYTLDRCRFFGIKVEKNAESLYVNGVVMFISSLSNDEINSLTVSPKVYTEFIFPYEKQLADFYGGIGYYHSCGDLTHLLPYIKELPGLEVFHVGPWTNLKKARDIMGKDVILQCCLFAERDIFFADESQMKKKMHTVLEENQGGKLQIVADSFMTGPWEKVKTWLKIARSIVG